MKEFLLAFLSVKRQKLNRSLIQIRSSVKLRSKGSLLLHAREVSEIFVNMQETKKPRVSRTLNVNFTFVENLSTEAGGKTFNKHLRQFHALGHCLLKAFVHT